MSNGDLNWIANFIWGIADDVLRDLYVRGKYRDVILPMTVLRRLDAVLEPTKQAVLDMKKRLDAAGITNQDQALRQAAGQSFYNTSKFTHRDLRARASQQQLEADFEAYLDGYSPDVQEIFDSFEFRKQIPRLSRADALGTLIEKFLDPAINLSPNPVLNSDGSQKYPALDNHAMGTIFEELVRRFNEENNEEAGEHWTPRDAVKLMAKLIFLRIADQIESGTYLLYDGACGIGGMLTVGEETLQQLAKEHGKKSPRTFTVRISTRRHTRSARPTCCLKAKERRRITSLAARSIRRSQMMPFLRASLTSCSPTLPAEKAGRATSNAWAAGMVSTIPGLLSSMPAIRNIL
jgi:type I restriction enzyme M protein